jgi:peptidoglycan/LPS O-acetylase OafA/YrhL
MDTREFSDTSVSNKSSINGNSVKERPLPGLDTPQLKGHPRGLVQDHGDRSSGAPSSAVSRLLPVEGLRAYLALWVVVDHVLWISGYEWNALTGFPRLMGLGTYAVHLFILISGFVIALTLDKQRETYWEFIVRRFFRLFPVFIVLFVVAIPLSHVHLWNVTHAGQYFRPDQIIFFTEMLESWWANIQWNIPLHVLMLHGTAPEVLVKGAPGAFLVPAWSVSLEWQFYLVAPLAYAWAVSVRPYRRIGLCALCVVLVLAARYVLPEVEYGAALPSHVKFFFMGAASYFLYKHRAAHSLPNLAFPIACCLALFLFGLSERQWSLIPVLLWLVFMGLLLEHPSSFSSRLVAPLLTNPVVLYLGRISYSLYLSHILVIIVIQYALLTWVPDLSQMVHFGVLLAGTTAVTIALSAVLYRYLEVPGIQAGRVLARRVAARREAGMQDEIVLTRKTEFKPLRSGHPAP